MIATLLTALAMVSPISAPACLDTSAQGSMCVDAAGLHVVSAWGDSGCIGGTGYQVCAGPSNVTLMRENTGYPGTFTYVTHVGRLTEEG